MDELNAQINGAHNGLLNAMVALTLALTGKLDGITFARLLMKMADRCPQGMDPDAFRGPLQAIATSLLPNAPIPDNVVPFPPREPEDPRDETQ